MRWLALLALFAALTTWCHADTVLDQSLQALIKAPPTLPTPTPEPTPGADAFNAELLHYWTGPHIGRETPEHGAVVKILQACATEPKYFEAALHYAGAQDVETVAALYAQSGAHDETVELWLAEQSNHYRDVLVRTARTVSWNKHQRCLSHGNELEWLAQLDPE